MRLLIGERVCSLGRPWRVRAVLLVGASVFGSSDLVRIFTMFDPGDPTWFWPSLLTDSFLLLVCWYSFGRTRGLGSSWSVTAIVLLAGFVRPFLDQGFDLFRHLLLHRSRLGHDWAENIVELVWACTTVVLALTAALTTRTALRTNRRLGLGDQKRFHKK